MRNVTKFVEKYSKAFTRAGLTESFKYRIMESCDTEKQAKEMLITEITDEIDTRWYTKTQNNELKSIIKRLEKEKC